MRLDRPHLHALILPLLLCGGCASYLTPASYLGHYGIRNPQVAQFEVCTSAGCRRTETTGYSTEEWAAVESIFSPAPADETEERERIALAIALMEQIVGEKTGTGGDLPMNQRRGATGPQLDCIAEAVNTTIALTLIEQKGLLRFHRVGYPKHRGFLNLTGPHNTATVESLPSGQSYVVDSWFRANGEPPCIVTTEVWVDGYHPPKD